MQVTLSFIAGSDQFYGIVPNPVEVSGISLIVVDKAPSGSKYAWIIKKIWLELNSGAYLINLGVYTATCPMSEAMAYGAASEGNASAGR